MRIGFNAPRILDFDIEMRPLGWLGGDFVHSEVTAIASCWADDYDSLECPTITKRLGSEVKMLKEFVKRYDEADIVTGHYIRNFDLPSINAALMEFDLEPLGEKFTIDTKNDHKKARSVSKSQENLGYQYGLEAPKVHMNAGRWREANRLTTEGIEFMKERAMGDVIQHMELRLAMTDANVLNHGKVWRP